MKKLLAAFGIWACAGAVAAQTVSELSEGGLVVLNSHYDAEKGVIVFLMGDIQGAPLYVCQTRFSVREGDSFDQCRKLR